MAAVLWGIDGIILRPSLYSLPVAIVVFVETAIATTIMSLFLFPRLHAIKKLRYKDWIAFGGVAFLGGVCGTMSITKALFYVNFVNLSIVILIQKLQPVFAIILARLLLNEKLPRAFFVWAGMAIVGAYFLTFGASLPNLSTGDKTLAASLFALLAAFGFASATVFGKRALRHTGFEIGTFLRFLLTSLMMMLVVSVNQEWPALQTISIDQIKIFLLIAFSTGAPAIFLYYFGLKRIKASVATICELAFPLTAVILEYFVRGNILDAVQWTGALIMIAGILRVTKMK